MLLSYITVLCTLSALAASHGAHNSDHAPGSWAEYHMAEEHHVSNFDAPSFFTLHDFNSDGMWSPEEVRKMYGLDDESLKDVPARKKDDGVLEVFKIFDLAQTGRITRDSFIEQSRAGKKLPDLGLGSGHHGDDEYEYEIHHFEKYHDENTKEEDLTHPEDIEHFRKHDLKEDEEIRIAKEQTQRVVENNIPKKFRKQE